MSATHSDEGERFGAEQSSIDEHLLRVRRVLYIAAGLLFAFGFYYDWKQPGQNLIPMFRIADEPHANSGLFIAAILVVLVGYVIARVAWWFDMRRASEIEEETQEWEVDLHERS